MDKKENDDGLDASFIISQTKSRNRPHQPHEGEADEEPATGQSEQADGGTQGAAGSKDDNRRRKGKGQNYESLFIRDAPSNTRSGKTVYIRKEFHDRIMRIVQVIGKNELSLYSYIDNVLEHHFATFQNDILELYKERNSDIF